MTSSGLKQVVQAQAAPQRTIQPHPTVQSPTPRGTVSVVRQSSTPPVTSPPAAPAATESESLMPNEELNGIDSEHIGDASIEEAPPVQAEETVVTQDVADEPPEAVQEEVVQENVSEPSESN